MHENTLVISS